MKKILTRHEADKKLTMWFDKTLWLPFIESDDGDITGPGHQNKEAFASTVTEWDKMCWNDPDMNPWDSQIVSHHWVIVTSDEHGEIDYNLCDPDTEGAVPVTTMWGIR